MSSSRTAREIVDEIVGYYYGVHWPLCDAILCRPCQKARACAEKIATAISTAVEQARSEWNRTKPIDADPVCVGCGGPHAFDTTVPSPTWNRIIRGRGLPDYLCTTCIVRAFVLAGEGFTAELWSPEFNGVPIEVRVRNAAAQTAADLGGENTILRAALSTAEGERDKANRDCQRLAQLHADLECSEERLQATAEGLANALETMCRCSKSRAMGYVSCRLCGGSWYEAGEAPRHGIHGCPAPDAAAALTAYRAARGGGG